MEILDTYFSDNSSKNHNWENCWTQNIEDAKNGVLKYQQYLKNKKKN